MGTKTPLRLWIAGLVVALSGLGVYANSLQNELVFDDLYGIRDNLHIRSLWPLTESLTGPPGSGSNGRPLVALSLALNYAADGLNVVGYHAFNVLVHVLCGLAILGLARRLHALYRGVEPPDAHADGFGFALALLWTVHPLCSSALDHVVYRNEAMASLFIVASVYASVRGLGGSKVWSVATVAAALAGVLSKEIAYCTPLLVLLVDRAVGAGSVRAALARRPAMYAGLAASLLVLAALVLTGERGRSVGFEQEAYGPLGWAQLSAGILFTYLKLAFWPNPLVLDYEGWPRPEGLADWLPAALGIAVLLAAAVVAAWRKAPGGVASLAFFALLAPTTSFVPITGMVAAEHRMYLPLACVLAVVLVVVDRLLPSPVARKAGLAVAMLVAAVLGWRTHERNEDYASQVTIWQDTVEKRPTNPRAWDTLGQLYAETGLTDLAEDAYRHAIALEPGEGRIHYNLGNLLVARGRIGEAVKEYETALHVRPDLVRARINLGVVLLRTNHVDEGVRELTRALADAPESEHARRALAWHYATHPDAARRNAAEAVRLAEGLAVDAPSPVLRAQALDVLAAAYAEAGRFPDAVETAGAALEAAQKGEAHKLASTVRRHMAEYQAGRAWHEPVRGASANDGDPPP